MLTARPSAWCLEHVNCVWEVDRQHNPQPTVQGIHAFNRDHPKCLKVPLGSLRWICHVSSRFMPAPYCLWVWRDFESNTTFKTLAFVLRLTILLLGGGPLGFSWDLLTHCGSKYHVGQKIGHKCILVRCRFCQREPNHKIKRKLWRVVLPISTAQLDTLSGYCARDKALSDSEVFKNTETRSKHTFSLYGGPANLTLKVCSDSNGQFGQVSVSRIAVR